MPGCLFDCGKHSSCIFEAEPCLPKNLRASTFHPPTLDFLEPFGASKILIDEGLIAPTFQYRDREKGCLAEFNFDLISAETNHPFRVQCEQFKLNLYLLDWLSKQGVEDIYFNPVSYTHLTLPTRS